MKDCVRRRAKVWVCLATVRALTGLTETALATDAGIAGFEQWKPEPVGHGEADGSRLVVRGNGQLDVRYYSPNLELRQDGRYLFSAKAKGEGTGTVVVGTDCVNVDTSLARLGGEGESHAFRMPFSSGCQRLHLGHWRAIGEFVFSDVVLRELKCEYAAQGGLELGYGESVSGRTYRFKTKYAAFSRNDARPLERFDRVSFNSSRWCFGQGAEVVYRHELPCRRWKGGQFFVSCIQHSRGEALLEVSADGKPWERVGKIVATGKQEIRLRDALFPADSLRVRFVAPGDCSLQIDGYEFLGSFSGAEADLQGTTEYIDVKSGASVRKLTPPEPPDWYRARHGERLEGDGLLDLWRTSAGWKVFRETPVPTGLASSGDVRIQVAANEAEAVQLVVNPTSDLADIRVEPDHPLPVEVLRVGYVAVKEPTDETGRRGMWPDPLLPQEGAVAVSRGRNQPFWVRVRPPKGTKPGAYSGMLKVRVKSSEGKSSEIRVPLVVEVFGFALPDETTCKSLIGIRDGQFERHFRAERGTEAYARVYAQQVEALAAHRLSAYRPTTCGEPWRDVKWTRPFPDPSSEPQIDWREWDREYGHVVRDLHAPYFRLVPLGLFAEADGYPRINGASYTNGLYDVYMGRYLKAIQDHLEERGWLENALVYWYDEPKPVDYPVVIRGMETVRKHAPKLRRLLTNQPEKPLAGHVDVWCPVTPTFFSAAYPERRRAGDEFWWYVCMQPVAPYATLFVDHAGVEMRVWLWQTWKEKVSGVLIWGCNYWGKDPWGDAMSSYGAGLPWGNGDGRLFYPPLSAPGVATGRSDSRLIDTIRVELLRDGIEDYEYFAVLERLSPGHPLLAVPPEVTRSLTDFSADPSPIERHRLKLAREIERRLDAKHYTKVYLPKDR